MNCRSKSYRRLFKLSFQIVPRGSNLQVFRYLRLGSKNVPRVSNKNYRINVRNLDSKALLKERILLQSSVWSKQRRSTLGQIIIRLETVRRVVRARNVNQAGNTRLLSRLHLPFCGSGTEDRGQIPENVQVKNADRGYGQTCYPFELTRLNRSRFRLNFHVLLLTNQRTNTLFVPVDRFTFTFTFALLHALF